MKRRTFFRAGAGLFLSQMMWGQREAWGQTSSRNFFALHIGINRVNPASYGSAMPLNGCIADAQDYSAIIRGKRGFKRILLTDSEATAGEVYRHIVWAANKLNSGDLFVLTYAGHGSYASDTSRPPDEDDSRDETMCLYDRMLLDDELSLMWGQFKEGVRIVFISDSCHSGTVARAGNAAERLADAAGNSGNRSLFQAVLGNNVDLTRTRDAAVQVGRSARGAVRSRGPAAELSGLGEAFAVRSPSEAEAERIYALQRKELDPINASVRVGDGRGTSRIQASGLLLAACQDWEVAQEAAGQGVFTGAIKKSVGGAQSYQKLLDDAKSDVGRLTGYAQTPKFFPFGKQSIEFESQAPFSKDSV